MANYVLTNFHLCIYIYIYIKSILYMSSHFSSHVGIFQPGVSMPCRQQGPWKNTSSRAVTITRRRPSGFPDWRQECAVGLGWLWGGPCLWEYHWDIKGVIYQYIPIVWCLLFIWNIMNGVINVDTYIFLPLYFKYHNYMVFIWI